MGLYSNTRRMTAAFCTSMICVTIGVLVLRLTVFSDMAAAVTVETPGLSAGSSEDELSGDSDFLYKLNRQIYFAKPTSKGNVLILNPEESKYLISVNILLPETKDSLYYTGAIAPGTFIESAGLSSNGKELENGVYECIAEIYAIDPEDMTKMAKETKSVTIYIGKKP